MVLNINFSTTMGLIWRLLPAQEQSGKYVSLRMTMARPQLHDYPSTYAPGMLRLWKLANCNRSFPEGSNSSLIV